MGIGWKIGKAARPSFRANRIIQRRSSGCHHPHEFDAKRRLRTAFGATDAGHNTSDTVI
jgi:hypothetical protein